MGSVVYSHIRFLQNHTLESLFVFAFPLYVHICFLPGQYLLNYLPFFLFQPPFIDNFDIDFA